ncbi:MULTISPECIES: TonB-dependent receptor [unclassified Novosphingobium]|uniref:TonB-dependent receptor n=1 Tax=unclassified Novosphingobium TaxID=2644732 RepID=UPI000EEA6FE6|nr:MULTISPECIES: TonB-dependent receptor [unclassified Novosphingobium]HCF24519.1 TonB-dependent receptor [Novosphingobium sp.]HQV03332.1 TonB-dependent receptor [Novosphingobium sp.]
MKLSASLRFSAAALAIGLTLSAAAPALAQDAAADDEGLDEIIVTAQRRAENQKDVPLSVATLGGDTLQAVSGAGADIRALSGRVPSLNIESSFGRTFPRFYIRGLGNTDFDLNASQPVSLVYDDVVLENPILKGFPVFDLDRVEVLRGPQGTLFGRNTPAGIVKFDSVKPDAKGKNYVRASYGSFGTINAEGGVGGDLTDGISARVSMLYQHRNNWVDNVDIAGGNDLEGFDDFAARLQLQAKAGDALTLRLTGQVRTFEGSARVFRANAFAKGSNTLIGLGGPATEFDRRKTRADGLNFQRLNNYNVGFTAEYDAGPVTITSVTSYWNGNLASRGDIDGGFGNQFAPTMGPGFIPFSAQSQDDVPSLDQFTQELRIASNNTGGLGYQLGVFVFNEKLDITSYDFGAPTDTTPAAIATQRQDSDALGLFGSVNYQFESGLKLQAGMRYNHDKRDMVAARPVDTRPGFLGFGGPVTPQTAQVSGNVLTWDVSATAPLSADVNVFARVARGYRAPSIQGRLAFGRTLSVADKETTMSYEAGLKSTLGNKARFNLTGFYFSTNDMQLTAVGGASNFTTLINADKVDGYGFEAEFEAKPVEGLTLSAGLSYNHNEIKDPNLYVAGCGAPCTVTNTQRVGSPGIYSINGNQLPQSPRWIANWTAGYEAPVGNGHVYLFTDWAYRSKIQFFLYNSVEFSDDNMLEGGLRIGYRTDRFDIAAFGRNITNDVSAVSGIDFNNLTAMVNEPRIWGVEVGVKF